MTATPPAMVGTATPLRHEAFLHHGDGAFVQGAAAFIREGLARREPVLVMVTSRKLDLLRTMLRRDAAEVRFADMGRIGANPARILPTWLDFVAEHAGSGRALRGIGEPIWPGRGDAELAECHVLEGLLNLAIAGAPLWLLCPYDVAALAPEVIERAGHTHPLLGDGARSWDSPAFAPVDARSAFAGSFPPPGGPVATLDFDATSLDAVRQATARAAARAGLRSARVGDLVAAVSEAAANSLRHGGGRGTLRTWPEADRVVGEVADQAGRFDTPLAGRVRPGPDLAGARGLWLANQLCDLVQVRSSAAGTAVRLHMRHA